MPIRFGDWDERLGRGRSNSFDLLRLILASLVVLEHSFFLIDGNANRDPLFIFTGGQSNCGAVAVYFFFVISGFLVTRSWLTDPYLNRFIARRIARIVPGFLAATAIGYLLIGPLAAHSVKQYFLSQNWVSIIVQTLALKQAGVTGAFTGNPVHLVHGTLWTIQYEFDCYLAIALLGAIGLMGNRKMATFIAIAAALALAAVLRNQLPVIDYGWRSLLISSPDRWPEFFPFFFCGSAFYVFRNRVPKTSILLWLSILTLLFTAVLGGFHWACLVCGAYAVLFLALSTGSNIKILGRKVDLSYGIYLYGWPIQQLLLFFFLAWMTPLLLFPAAMVFTCATAWASWLFIEKPCLVLVRNRKVERPAIVTGNIIDENEAALIG